MPPKDLPLFVILDGYSMAYRHYHGTLKQALKAPTGETTGAVYGFSRQMLDIMLKDKPAYIAVAWDAGLSGRELMYTAYKANRSLPPDDFEPQVDRVREVLTALNVPMLELEGFEADDVIGTIVRHSQREDVYTRIITGDGDLLQLITPKVDVFLMRPYGGPKLYDREAFKEKYKLEPHQLVDLKALQGDSSDNIPGVKGVGEKTAAPLIAKYGSLPALYKHLDEVKGATRKKLDGGRSQAFMSYELARIRCDLPMQLDLAACTTGDFDREAVLEIFEELGFTSLTRHLLRAEEDNTQYTGSSNGTAAQQMAMFAADEVDVAAGEFVPQDEFKAQSHASEVVNAVAVVTEAGLQAVVALLNNAEFIAFDTETTGLDPVQAELVGISLAVEGDTGYYIPLNHVDADHDQLPLDTVIEALRGPLTNPNIPKAAHNAAYDLVVLRRYGLDVTPITFDTMIAEWVRDSASNDLGLTNLALRRGLLAEDGILMQDIKDLIGKGKKQRTFDTVPLRLAAPYAAEDAAITYRLVKPLRRNLDSYDAAGALFADLEMPLVPVLASMQQCGVLIDVAFLGEMSANLERQLGVIEREAYDLSGGYGEFNLNSPKQLNDVLFGKLDLPRKGIRKTTHGYSTAADVLDRLFEETGHPILAKIIEHRELSKLKGTYVDALPELVNPETGRLHTSFNQTGTSTGRLSSSNPNLQNIPIRTEVGREVRRAFITPPGTVLLAVDYSQVELRIMAHMADEPFLKASFERGDDIHRATAAIVNSVDIDAVTIEQRIFAKRVNFGILYGMGAFRLARDSDLTLAEADDFIKTYFERLPAVQQYIENTKAKLREEGFVETIMGRRRYFGDVGKMGHNDRARTEREAINMPIQGSAADIIKKAMVQLDKRLRDSNLNALMTLQVHDELVFEVPEDELDETVALVVEVMEGAFDLTPQLKAKAEVGSNWREMHTVGGN
jgi:DNA polymerase I